MTTVDSDRAMAARGHRHRPGMPWIAARAAAAEADSLPVETVPLSVALGAVAARDVRALVALPPLATSAMDGFAVRGAGPWHLVGRLDAGHGCHAPLRPGETVQISTGAPVPEGTDAVLPVEHAEQDGSVVRGAALPGRHIRPAGEDALQGELLLPAGSPLTPSALGLLAAAGYDELSVRRRPRCAALLTGDEILTRGLPHGAWVRDAIGPMLPGLLAGLDCDLVTAEHVADTPAERLEHAVAGTEADVLLVCGATSAGPTDRLRPLLAKMGARVVVDGVACRPGHPQLLVALPDGRWLVGLPGNPFAALVAVHTLLAPLSNALQGRPARALRRAPFTDAPAIPPGQTRIVPARWHGNALTPVPGDRPAFLQAAAVSDALAVLAPERLGNGWSEVLLMA